MLQKRSAYYYLFGAIGLLLVIRLISVLFSPPGFFLDEAATGAHVASMLQHGTNAQGQAWPLFSSSLGGGYTTPVYLYPLTAWATLFGASELSLRFFSQISTIAAVLILGLAMKYWLDKRTALVTVIVGLALPWGWLQGSLAWDPALVPFFVSTSFLGFTWLLYGGSRQYKTGLVLLPTSLLALAYLYPPCRVSAPLLFVAAYWLLYVKQRISVQATVVTCGVLILAAWPLLNFMLQPGTLARSRELSVFQAGIGAGLSTLLSNLAALVNPSFLFVTGDPNLRHSTGMSGMLGTVSILPSVALAFYAIKRRVAVSFRPLFTHEKQLLCCIALFGAFVGLASSALTNEGQPHSLRAVAAWPFIVILLSLGWLLILEKCSRRVVQVALLLFVCSTALYAVDLVYFYPSRAATAFDVPVRQQIYSGRPTPTYPDLALEYYRKK